MSTQSILKEAKQLPPEERIRLARSILQSVAGSVKKGEVSPVQLNELLRRQAAYKAHQSGAITWEELRKKARSKRA
ncbi:MAG: addiction module protein [Planctomycetota bacterium]|nr:addiction module protein [Planctomycetota bacterium]